MFGGIYRGRRVLVTGHTGFKGSWLALWLNELGAELGGVALEPPTEPAHFPLLHLAGCFECLDIRDLEALKRFFFSFKPEIVFHLAAQALVRPGYRDPSATFAANVMGTVNVLEAARLTDSVRAVVAVTSDKCYENFETGRPCVETDPMGGFDPYSASKGCAELAVSCYRRAFFNAETGSGKPKLLLASARAGNVVGGGDWAEARLVPDLVRSAVAGRVEPLRSPGAVRPWQHVLEPLSGYLALGAGMLAGDGHLATGWNFGPGGTAAVTVGEVAGLLARRWEAVRFEASPSPDAPHEAKLLRLDCSKARRELGWYGVWDVETALAVTADWYHAYYRERAVRSSDDLASYCAAAAAKGLSWTN